tara:strand:+ start:481 stop:759 length:279 start_codon:yes stop_codon:yes gene_type:complete
MIKEINDFGDICYRFGDSHIQFWQSSPSPQNNGGPCVTICIKDKIYGDMDVVLNKAPLEMKEFIIHNLDMFAERSIMWDADDLFKDMFGEMI